MDNRELISTDIHEPIGQQPEVKCFLVWRGFAPYQGQEKLLLMTVA